MAVLAGCLPFVQIMGFASLNPSYSLVQLGRLATSRLSAAIARAPKHGT